MSDGRTDGQTYGRTDPNYRKASLLKMLSLVFDKIFSCQQNKQNISVLARDLKG